MGAKLLINLLIVFIMCAVRSLKIMLASPKIKFAFTADPRKVKLKSDLAIITV